MLKQLRVENFKSIQTSMGDIRFGNLTIIAGANSSGKSSVIQSLMTLMQTLDGNQVGDLQFNGDLVTLGKPTDVWHNGDVSVPLTFHFILEENGRDYEYFTGFSVQGDIVQLVWGNYEIRAHDQDEQWGCEIARHTKRKVSYKLKDWSETVMSMLLEEANRIGMTDISDDAIVVPHKFLPQGIRLKGKRASNIVHFLNNPLGTAVENHGIMEDTLVNIIQQAIDICELPTISPNAPSRNQFLGLSLASNNASRSITTEQYAEWYSHLSTKQAQDLADYYRDNLREFEESAEFTLSLAFFDALRDVVFDYFVRRTRYLSANRIAPRALFMLADAPHWSEVGINGENIAVALNQNANKQVKYWHPSQHKIQRNTLLNALVSWLRYLELLDDIEVQDYGKLGTFIQVRSVGIDKDLDLTSIGFGTSQVLPILVQGLLTPPGGMFIVEQPEVHLHPKVQSLLAYFFLALTNAGVQCIVETHSEYIVDKIRLLIAEGNVPREKVNLYFARRDPEYGTGFEAIQVSESGTILNRPSGFMDESTNLANDMIRAALKS
jgi:predicted ATPase